MGCGALCGDTTTAESINDRHSKRSYSKAIESIIANQPLAASPTYAAFLSDYHQRPDPYHLRSRPHLVSGEEVSDAVLLKWKLVVFGLDKDDQKYCECLGLNNEDKSLIIKQPQPESHYQSALAVHECFVQIEKDIDRTFDTPVTDGKKRQFENVLKRIANHFPKMGYTQGINFLVSYFIVIGYSQEESFAMFVHLATNKKYMLLGLYEDGFPLYTILTILLQNVLQRANQQLYTHMFLVLGVDPSMWICKWFMTFYIYSFPKELIKYVFDLVVSVGNLGMITFAVSLIEQLQDAILDISEISDLNDFLTSLKNIETFNQYINMQRLMAKAYSVTLVISDFKDLEEVGFYGVYIKSYFQLHHQGRTEGTPSELYDNFNEGLNKWRQSLIEQRNIFKRNSRSANISHLRLEIQSLEKSINKGSIIDSDAAIAPHTQDDPTMSSTSEMPKVRRNSISSKSEAPIIIPIKVDYDFNRINEKIEEEEQSIGSKYDCKSKRSKQPLPVEQLDELDKLQIYFKQEKKPKPTMPSIPRNNFTNPHHNKNISHRISTYNPPESNTLTMAARNSLRNDPSYDDVSISSKQTSNKSKIKHAQNGAPRIGRICACKTKTEENKFSNVEQGSEIEQSKDQFSDKDSISNNNFSQNGQHVNDSLSIRGVDTHRDRCNNRKDFMVNSHGPGVIVKREQTRFQSDIEVMVLQQQFKKNKRGRVKQVPAEMPADKLFKIGWQQQQDSLQEIHQMQQLSQANSHCSHLEHTYEIESVK